MHIVFDTSAIYPDLKFKSIHFELLELFRDYECALHFPAVVIKELNKKAGEDLRDASKTIVQANKKIASIHDGIKPQELSDFQIEKILSAYAGWLDNFCQARGDFIPLPEVKHEILLNRLASGKKPFSTDGKKGYRDALIWFSILEQLVKEPGEYIFITTDANDFCDENGVLHKDLQEDIPRHSSVVICKGIKRFVDDHIIPRLPDSKKTYADLIKKYPALDIEEKVLHAFYEKVVGEVINHHLLNVPHEIKDIGFIGCYGTMDFQIHVMKEIEKTKTLIEFSFKIGGIFISEIYQSDYYRIGEKIPASRIIHEGEFLSVEFEEEFEIRGVSIIDISGKPNILSVEINQLNGYDF